MRSVIRPGRFLIAVLMILVSGETHAQSPGPVPQTVQLSDGSSGSPPLSFFNEPTLGLYRSGPGRLEFPSAIDLCTACYNGETMFSIRGARGDSTGYWFRITHTDDGVIAPHVQVERNGGVHVTHYLQVSNDFWVGPPHWHHPVYSDGTNEVGGMIMADSDITGYQAGATIVSFGLPSYRLVTGARPSLFQGYGSVVFSAGAGGGQLTGTKVFEVADDGAMQIGNKLFASLPASSNGTMYYCPDCSYTNPCMGGGTGAFAKRLNNSWRCD